MQDLRSAINYIIIEKKLLKQIGLSYSEIQPKKYNCKNPKANCSIHGLRESVLLFSLKCGTKNCHFQWKIPKMGNCKKIGRARRMNMDPQKQIRDRFKENTIPIELETDPGMHFQIIGFN